MKVRSFYPESKDDASEEDDIRFLKVHGAYLGSTEDVKQRENDYGKK